MQVQIQSVYDVIDRHDPKSIALISHHLQSWTDKEDGEDVVRHKLVGRADQFSAILTEKGISYTPIRADEIEIRKAEVFECDLCVVTGDPCYRLVRPAALVMKAGFERPILMEMLEEDAKNQKNMNITVTNAKEYSAIELLSNFVYLLKGKPSPRSIEFDVEEIQGQSYAAETKIIPLELMEGRRYISVQTRPERNEKARLACIQHYGAICAVCNFEFSRVYGASAAGLIHVHHLDKISNVKAKRVIDPVRDLRPVCPNCHLVIHSRDPMYSVEQLRKIVAQNQA